MRNSRIFLVVLVLLLAATSAWASNFRGADLIYLNGVINFTSSATFVSQVIIHNHSTISLDVDAAYLPSGDRDNSNFTLKRVASNLGAGKQVVFDDFLGEAMGETGGDDFGHAIFFACKAGLSGDCDCVASPGDCGPITVESRVYAFQGSASTGTTGQLFPGYPWYSYVSRDVADRSLDKIRILGLRADASFRSNIGYANSSAFSTTNVEFKWFDDNGVLKGTANRSLKPLQHGQENATTMFPGFSGSGYVEVRQTTVTPTNTSDPDCPDGCPGFFAYGSVADNITNDATTLEAIYLVEFDYEQVYGAKPAHPARRGVRRPGQ